ncbi:MAG: class I SAM-dependent methyltransferase [Planctomycetaceae bacterium]|jgi:SAM-dependent methyltransferase|nr:class I SAM-dependent methyltransferase [Planctomycetaceae bacterium]
MKQLDFIKRILNSLITLPEKNYVANLMILSKLTGETLLRTDGKISEYLFWDHWFASKGSQWHSDYVERLDNNSVCCCPHSTILDQLSNNFSLSEILILDVGAGPLTCINKNYKNIRLNITAVDVLADLYDEILKKNGINPPIRTQLCSGEKLNEMFSEKSFHWINGRNTLDHMEQPLKCIMSMLDLLKPEGIITLFHKEYEGKQENYSGYHQWDFFVNDGDFCISRRNNEDFTNVTRLIPPTHTIETKMSTIINGEIEVFIKRNAP